MSPLYSYLIGRSDPKLLIPVPPIRNFPPEVHLHEHVWW